MPVYITMFSPVLKYHMRFSAKKKKKNAVSGFSCWPLVKTLAYVLETWKPLLCFGIFIIHLLDFHVFASGSCERFPPLTQRAILPVRPL